jgi:hypothetical protein
MWFSILSTSLVYTAAYPIHITGIYCHILLTLESHKMINHRSKKKTLSTDTRRMVAELWRAKVELWKAKGPLPKITG